MLIRFDFEFNFVSQSWNSSLFSYKRLEMCTMSVSCILFWFNHKICNSYYKIIKIEVFVYDT